MTNVISKFIGDSFTISGNLKNVGNVNLNVWTKVVLKGPTTVTYSAYPKISIPVGATVAFQKRTHTIGDIPTGDYKVYISVGDDSAPFQDAYTDWIIRVCQYSADITYIRVERNPYG